MYYPHDTTIDMGATAVVPGSAYWSVDRSGFFQSEDRLEFSLQPARNTGGLGQWHSSLQEFNGLATLPDLDARDERLSSTVGLLLGQDGATAGDRDPEASDAGANLLRERFVEVPAGSAVIMHFDVFHRGTRKRTDEAAW